MIGTIRPNREALKCLGLTRDITNAMCRTCNATSLAFGSFARLCLSHDSIFLALFSADDKFTSARLRRAPLRCVASDAAVDSPDAHYLAGITLFMFASKVHDGLADGEISLRPWTQRKIRTLSNQAESRLGGLGLPVEEVKAELDEYTSLESHGTRTNFADLARPIARAYGMVFENLPSRANRDADKAALRDIGSSYGELTLLVDAVEDTVADSKAGRFNAWQAASDLPADLTIIKGEITRRFAKLAARAGLECPRAADYLQAAQDATLQRLSRPQQSRARVFTHPAAMIASISCCEQDCFGNASLTPTGMCIAVLACAACIACCSKK